MARRHTLAWIAASSTVALWTATVALSLNDLGSDRIHLTLRTAALLAGVTTLALLGAIFIRMQVDRIRGDLADARGELADARGDLADARGDLVDSVRQVADEIHTAVAETGDVLRVDRTAVDVARQLLASELVKARQGQGLPQKRDADRAA